MKWSFTNSLIKINAMSKKIIIVFAFLIFGANQVICQEKYGRTLNLGGGIGYYGNAAAASINFEFDVFRNFTLAPFVSVLTYRNYRYWGNPYYPYRDYYYRETIVPVGVKASYYFDELFRAGSHWDFYAAASVGAAFRTTVWESGYYGDRTVRQYSSPLYGNLHIGAEYHITSGLGLFLDLSTGLSTFGLGIHF
jgi:hypothetical protein